MVDYGVKPEARKQVAVWLLVVALMVLGMVIVGGLTRLTNSGLSMVDWKPIMGAVPPLNEADWQARFDQYKAFPEYQKINKGMSLAEFKFIFGMEYGHRLLGRFVGLVFFLPFLWFLIRKKLGKPMIWRGWMLFILGGAQGVMGWYMVASGLVDEPRVSQYRLTAHLFLAILVFTLCVWYALSLLTRETPERSVLHSLGRWPLILLGMIGLQIASGGFVAGLDAGYAFNTWPTMNGQWVPQGLFSFSPWISNFFDNPVMVQFFHRCWAYVVTLAIIVFWARFATPLKGSRSGMVTHLLMILLMVQVGLGIATLLMRVPPALGSMHQVCALALWTCALFLTHRQMLARADAG